MTRIVAGAYGGRRIATPPGRDTRPTSDRVREALFGSLGPLDGTRFLDLYAGSGAIGLEAASRGAAHVLLVESDPKAARAARDNVTLLGAARQVTLMTARVAQVLAGGPSGAPYDVVFADPPYAAGEPEITGVLEGLVEHGWLAPGAEVVIERSRRSPEPAWVPCVTGERSRRYGDTTLWYGRGS
ncbi:MAG TPA: 16S rRNA (guanine(966)-N(2))-methyltransferase RsmD [Rugosimonospora sp.]